MGDDCAFRESDATVLNTVEYDVDAKPAAPLDVCGCKMMVVTYTLSLSRETLV